MAKHCHIKITHYAQQFLSKYIVMKHPVVFATMFYGTSCGMLSTTSTHQLHVGRLGHHRHIHTQREITFTALIFRTVSFFGCLVKWLFSFSSDPLVHEFVLPHFSASFQEKSKKNCKCSLPLSVLEGRFGIVLVDHCLQCLVGIFIIHCEAKKLHRFIFAINLSNQAIF